MHIFFRLFALFGRVNSLELNRVIHILIFMSVALIMALKAYEYHCNANEITQKDIVRIGR